MKTQSMLVFLISIMPFANAPATSGFPPAVLDTQVTCHLVTITRNGLPVGDLHNLGSVSVQFESTKSVNVDTIVGSREFIFGFGKAKINQMVLSWDANKNEIIAPLHVDIEVGLDAKGLKKTMTAAIAIVNPFTNQLETQKSFGSTALSDSFIYTEANFWDPNRTRTEMGAFSNVQVFCEFKKEP